MFFDFLRLGSIPSRTDRHRIAGITTIDGVPGKRLVVIFDRKTFLLIAAKWSDQGTGAWEIIGLPQYAEQQLLVLSVDHTGSYNADVADYVSQVTA